MDQVSIVVAAVVVAVVVVVAAAIRVLQEHTIANNVIDKVRLIT